MDLRIELMRRLAEGEKPSDLRLEYGISKKTLNKFRRRFALKGVAGLADESRAPKVIPHKSSPELEAMVVVERTAYPTWGPKKLKEVLEKRLGRTLPSVSTFGSMLVRNGLIQPKKRRPNFKAKPTGLLEAHAPNDLWCIDYKGQFRLGDRTYCYPLTLTDQYSRYLLCCEGMAAISDEEAREVCQEVFRCYGLPWTMRSDNGEPFASVGLAGLTKLSAYWMRLGIRLERIRPAHPEENGRHERMHRTLKAETTRPARANLLQQQERFDEFLDVFNCKRPHEALAMQCPADVYAPSTRDYPSTLPEPEYPLHDDAILIGHRGYLRIGRTEVYLAAMLAGQYVGIREQDDGRWLVTFCDLDLGHVAGKSFVAIDHSVPRGDN
jgi:transposase InsO family protein